MGLFAFSEDYNKPAVKPASDPKPVAEKPTCEIPKPEKPTSKTRKSKTSKPQPIAESISAKEVTNDVSV